MSKAGYTCSLFTTETGSQRLASEQQTVQSQTIPPNARNEYHVTHADLPLSCPMPGMSLWNSHPRVYLPIEETGRAKCPYCGAVYILDD
ncbi:MAG TPA: zinc-finger domain-containing protein [Chromatiales bacterium]|nr:zinc-finger domain-containing protein [Chromatiales bacterium]